MRSINVLDSETINKIAAGEVVERPSSVVKELVENSIDAKASAITVEIKDGGTSLIRVTDNGGGIDTEDIDGAFMRHATSKIKDAMDLLSLSSLGFRGEALSSIASVSRIELITKTHALLTGTRYLADGGEKILSEETGCPDGTTIIVRNLFYNTPARKKFLKTSQTEAGYVSELVSRLALSHPDVSFKFINNDQTRLHTAGTGNMKDIIYSVFGRDVTKQLLEVRHTTDLMTITGYIGKPALSRGNRSWENYFINGRYIKSNIVTKAIEDAYKTFVMVHKFPFTAMHINIDPSYIDVNVHPRKMEIRFTKNEEVYDQIYELVRGILTNRDLTVDISLDEKADRNTDKKNDKESSNAPEPFEIQRLASYGRSSGSSHISDAHGRSYNSSNSSGSPKRPYFGSNQQESGKQPITGGHPSVSVSKPYGDKDTRSDTAADSIKDSADPGQIYGRPEQLKLTDDRFLGKAARSRHRIIGQVFDTYWMAEYDGKLFIIDQHAAHEKVMYERLKKEFEKKQVHSQLLSPPAVVTLSMKEQELFSRYEESFKELCFEVEPFGGNEFAIYAVPLQLFGMDPGDLFLELLDNMSLESGSIEGSAVTYKIASMACKAAVKGDSRMSFEEADALIDELLTADDPYNCPHGRPTIISISKYEMEKRFKRIV